LPRRLLVPRTCWSWTASQRSPSKARWLRYDTATRQNESGTPSPASLFVVVAVPGCDPATIDAYPMRATASPGPRHLSVPAYLASSPARNSGIWRAIRPPCHALVRSVWLSVPAVTGACFSAAGDCAVHHYPARRRPVTGLSAETARRCLSARPRGAGRLLAAASMTNHCLAGKSARQWRERNVAWESGRDADCDPVRFSRVRLGGSGGGEGACT
jgi:hypothetical protein